MSLDVYLTSPEIKTVECTCPNCDSRHSYETKETVYSANTTHNLASMASEAGIYKELWRPDEIGIAKANQLIEPLESGLTLLNGDPERFQAFNAKNGWGLYEHLVTFVTEYLEACKKSPEADVSVSR